MSDIRTDAIEALIKKGYGDSTAKIAVDIVVNIMEKASREEIQNCTRYLTFGRLQIDHQLKIIKLDGKEVSLTPRQLVFIEYFMKNPNRVLPMRDILINVWGSDHCEKAEYGHYIRVFKANISKKFGENFIRSKHGFGYYLDINAVKSN